MVDVLSLGELLIDFVPTVSGVTLIEAPTFVKAPGGAPANVAVGLAKLGVSSGFLGKVGDDPFGRFLAATLAAEGVDTSALLFSREARTMLAFVSLTATGERDFMFYRHPSADMLYRPEEVPEALVRGARALHFGSISLIDEPCRSATLRAVHLAREAGSLVSYDPNLRVALWPNPEAARAGILDAWPLADVIKISEDELTFLTGVSDLATGAARLLAPHQRLLVVTRGEGGCYFRTPDFDGEVPGFAVHAVDATGAGDGFVSGLLRGLLRAPNATRDRVLLAEICRYANAVGAITTTTRGAIPALPKAAAVEAFLRDHGG